MNSDLCIGICSRNENLEIAAMEAGRLGAILNFPATEMGLEAIKAFLAGYENPVRLAVSGVAALSVAISLGAGPRSQVFIVSPSIADHSTALAQYAERSI
jgi:hypothetical protein